MPPKSTDAQSKLYEAIVEVAPRGPLPAIEDSPAYKPIVNSRDARLLEAKEQFRAEATSANRARHARLIESIRKRG